MVIYRRPAAAAPASGRMPCRTRPWAVANHRPIDGDAVEPQPMQPETALPSHCEVVIVGAGLAGLAAARALGRAGRDTVVLEASDGVGGRVRTDVVDGFRLDRGFQVLLTAYPELALQFDVDALDLRVFDPGAVVWDGHALHVVGDPIRRPSTMFSTATAPIGSILDKLRLLRQRVRLTRTSAADLLRQQDTSTLVALRSEGFSERIIDCFFRPLVGGIQLDPTLGTSRRVFDVVLASLLEGEVAVPAQGMGAIPEQLAAGLAPQTIHLHRRVAEVTPRSVTTVDGSRVTADRVIVATDGPSASALAGTAAVESNAATCVWYAAEASPVEGHAIVLDGTGAGPALNIVPMSNVAPEYAPAGRSLIAAACPGMAAPDVESAVRLQLRRIWGEQVMSWRHLRTDVIPHGQPRQYPPFSPKKPIELDGGLFVCGDHRDTASIQGALHSGRRCGEAVVASLT